MNIEPLISWDAPQHFHVEKSSDWYWSVGIITLSISVVAFMFGNFITGIFVLIAAVALVLHASFPPKIIYHEINDRGIIVDNTLHPFIALESFWIPHDVFPQKIILKSRKMLMPFIIIFVDEGDSEKIREILLRYIAETEHREPFLRHMLEWLGF